MALENQSGGGCSEFDMRLGKFCCAKVQVIAGEVVKAAMG